MKRFKEAVLFLLVSLLSSVTVFQDAMWGASIVAPLDLAPALWKHYHHVDPHQGPIPKNHYTIDQVAYDLPLQHLMYQAWRSDEVPWWNPFSLGGRPLLADAHCNGTDPVRLAVYFTVPDFVLAYNWTLILHAIGTGIGFFVLLRAFGVRPWLAGTCALAAQWAGGFVLYVGHPWVRGAFLYYPFLWLAWHRAFCAAKFSAAAAIPIAAIFYSGNLQSHAYLPLFAMAMGVGYAGLDGRKWWSFFRVAVPTGVLGVLIAAPVLVPQVELYLRSSRGVLNETSGWHALETAATLAGVHPWAAGTFRTVSLKSVSGGLSFHLAVGGAVVMLAIFGWVKRRGFQAGREVIATGGWLVLAFLLIVLTPLHDLLYLRAAGIGILGLSVLAGFGGEALLRSVPSEMRWSRATWIVAVFIMLGTTILAFGVYPYFRDRARGMLLARAESDGYGGASRALRNFQADQFAKEVSLQNPECVFNLVGLGILAVAFASCSPLRRKICLRCALAASMVPLLMFAHRFIVRAPVGAWARLLEGGPLQRSILAQWPSSGARLVDDAQQEFFRLFPQEIPVLHRLHVAHGYAALRPTAGFTSGEESSSAHLRVVSSGEISSAGQIRYYWKSGSKREVRIVKESLNRLRLEYPAGSTDVLIRSDTWYPGWTENGIAIKPSGPNGSLAEIPVAEGQTKTNCEYRPSGYRVTFFCALAGGVATALLAGFSNKRAVRVS